MKHKTQDSLKKITGVILGIAGLILPALLSFEGLDLMGQLALGIFLFAAMFWIFEPAPIWATSLLVIFLQVLLLSDQSLTHKFFAVETATPFVKYKDFYAAMAHPIIILFLGGFFLAAAAVKYGLDKNLTRIMLRLFGTRSAYVILGLMSVTALLSAFMSNTATAAMMITVVLPILRGLDEDDAMRIAVVLAIPVGANIGGIATPIGTPPNAVVLGALAKQGMQISFFQWMVLAVPLVLLMLFLAWRLLLWLFPPKAARLQFTIQSHWDTNKHAVGTYIIFALTVLLWVTDQLHGISSNVIAFLPIAAMPVLGIINRKDVQGFSWDVLWLMAGGLSLGIALNLGPAEWFIGLVDWGSLGSVTVILALALVSFTLSNLVSHTVATAIIVPIAVSLGISGVVGENFDVMTAAIIVGVISSFSMLLPISTPPNAIAMSTGLIETRHLVRIGGFIGILGIVFTLLSGFFIWSHILQ